MTVRLIDTTTVPNETRAALKSLRYAMTTSSNDWSTNRDFVWLYGILVGWTDDDGNDTVGELFAKRFGWSNAVVNRLLLHRAAVAAFMEEGR